MMKIRRLQEGDIETIAGWYNWYILNGTQTFETEVLSVDQFRERAHRIQKKFPYIVVEEDDVLCGYAYLDTFNQRAAYDWTCDLSIYVNPDMHGKGYGKALMQEIISLAKKDGYHSIISLITEGNTVSEHLHEQFGFVRYCLLPHVGFKMNRWLGVSWYDLQLSNEEGQPKPIQNR